MESKETAQAARVRARLANALTKEEGSPTLALALKRLQEAHSITPAEQAVQIGTTLVGLNRLALCSLPREDQFASDSEAIAKYCGCESGALLSLLRTIQVLETFTQASSSTSLSSSEALKQRWQGSGALVAARDAEETEALQKGTGSE